MSPLVLCFPHVPRTGGASTIHYLRDEKHFPDSVWMGDGGARPYQGGDTIGLGETWKKAFALAFENPIEHPYFCAGHFPYGVNDYLKHDNFHYMTLVRDPVKRIWSRYNTFLHAKGHPIHELWMKKYNFNIELILAAEEPEFSNDAVRLISGTDKVHIDANDYANALYLICDKYTYATCTERIPQYLLNELHEIFPQIRPGNMNVRHNTVGYGTIGESPSAKVREMILEHNQYDLQLYEFVKKHGVVGKGLIDA